MSRKRDDRSRNDPDGPFHNPFGDLKARLPDLPPGETPASASASIPAAPARAVVRYERKGRGGREVTVVEQLALGADELSVWLKELKKTLGCGGVIEGDTLVFQGDQRDRLQPLLVKRGVGRISVG